MAEFLSSFVEHLLYGLIFFFEHWDLFVPYLVIGAFIGYQMSSPSSEVYIPWKARHWISFILTLILWLPGIIFIFYEWNNYGRYSWCFE